MINNNLFTTHHFTIDSKGKPFKIYLFGDVHRDAPNHSLPHWKRFCETAEKENAYFIGMGDYLDMCSTSERRGFEAIGLHESTRETIEAMQWSWINKFSDEIGFMKDRCIGLLEGNHFISFQNGTTSTQHICQKLNCKYLGAVGYIALKIKLAGNTSMSYRIFVAHGRSGGRLLGTSLTQVYKLSEIANANLYSLGHDHKANGGKTARLDLTINKGVPRVSHVEQVFVRSGSFLRGYVENEPSYVAGALLNPATLGAPCVEISPRVTVKNKKKEYSIETTISI